MCIGFSATRIKRITGFLIGHCLLRNHFINLSLVEDTACRFYKLREETPLRLLRECDALIAKRDRNPGQYQIRMEVIPNLEVTKILNFLVDLVLDEL